MSNDHVQPGGGGTEADFYGRGGESGAEVSPDCVALLNREMSLYEALVYLDGDIAAAMEEEHERRRQIFYANREAVQKHNAAYRAGEETWFMALNAFADFTSEEFARLRGTKRGGTPTSASVRVRSSAGGYQPRSSFTQPTSFASPAQQQSMMLRTGQPRMERQVAATKTQKLQPQ